jgi:DNA (cytosine-5)-methyltransferase 1
MPPRNSHITVTDQFCGAGGSSQGVRRYSQRSGLGNGVQVHLALNHWKLAIETHSHNFPDTIHDCTDIQACDPRFYPSTDILITSPECTNHSVAKGRKQVKAQMDAFATGKQDAAAERSRATMWDVVRFTEHHRYRIIITENVVDARAWVLWDAWIMAMHNLGYQHQCVFYNSMFAWPTPQSRDRMYVVFWRKGQPKPDLDIRPKAPCVKCGVVEAVQSFKPKANVKAKYGTQYVYVCPHCGKEVMPFYFAAIDWTVPAVRIGERKKPLEERTMQRIKYGLEKYGRRPLSITVHYADGIGPRVRDAMSEPGFTEHTYSGSAICSPVMVETKYSHAGDKRAKSAADPLPGQTGQQSMGVALPFIMDSSFTKAKGKYMNAGDEPIGTQTTTQSKGVVIPPAFLVKQRGTSKGHVKSAASGIHEPIGTISAGGFHHALITGKAMAFLQSYYGVQQFNAMDDAMGALCTRDRHALVNSPLLGRGAGGEGLQVEDLYFRMLKAHEVKAGMAFDTDYTVLGNQREQVKQLGNAVTPPVMEILVERCIQSLM